MKSFSAFTHISGQEIRFVGDCWEEGGFHVNEAGDPTCDNRGNSVARFAVTEIDERDADLLELAYAGDEGIQDGDLFAQWMATEGGLSNAVIAAVCAKLGVAYSVEKLVAHRETMAIRDPKARLLDAIRKT